MCILFLGVAFCFWVRIVFAPKISNRGIVNNNRGIVNISRGIVNRGIVNRGIVKYPWDSK